MTAHALAGEREKCLAAGMDDYLSKPVKADELSSVLEHWSKRSTQPAEVIEPVETIEPAASPTMAAIGDAVDLTVLESFREFQEEGSPDFVGELIDLYLGDTQARFVEMRAALVGGDAGALQRVAHGLKGSSGNLGARRMASLCAELEETLRDCSLDGVEADMVALEAEFERVMVALSGERQMVTQ